MFKVNNKDGRWTPGVVLVSLLLTLNIFYTLLQYFFVNFKHVIAGREVCFSIKSISNPLGCPSNRTGNENPQSLVLIIYIETGKNVVATSLNNFSNMKSRRKYLYIFHMSTFQQIYFKLLHWRNYDGLFGNFTT